MTSFSEILAATAALLVAAAGCGQTVLFANAGGAGGSTTGSGAAVGSGTGAGTGAGSGTSVGSGTATGSSTGAGNGTSTGTGIQPSMVPVTSPNGVTYYISNTEISQASYALFLQSGPQPDPTSATCGWKTTFEPGMEPGDESASSPDSCSATKTHYDPSTHGADPVVCVDWCDADAYCRWAGGRVCGAIGGGPMPQAVGFTDATKDQWYNACSNGGTTKYPYGPTFVASACNAGQAVAPVGQTPGCHGTAPPFSEIFDMSGNVMEWEDSCGTNQEDPDGGARTEWCMLRGGSFGEVTVPPGLTYVCGGHQWQPGARDMEDSSLGIRCCAD